jgi:hypothetical protein
MSNCRQINAHPKHTAARPALLGAWVVAAGIALGGCVAYPSPPQGPILSRLPPQAGAGGGAQQAGAQHAGAQQPYTQQPYAQQPYAQQPYDYAQQPSHAPSAAPAAARPNLTPEQLRRYNEIDQEVLREQEQAMRNEAAVRAWSRAYSYARPVNVYGSYYSGGWGHGWGIGTGWGYPGYWW